MANQVKITGNTYPARDIIKSMMGGKWDATNKCWIAPQEKVDAALKKISSPSWGMSDQKAIVGLTLEVFNV